MMKRNWGGGRGSDGRRSISRKFVHNRWLESMESAAVCLFWRSGCPERVPVTAVWWKREVVVVVVVAGRVGGGKVMINLK